MILLFLIVSYLSRGPTQAFPLPGPSEGLLSRDSEPPLSVSCACPDQRSIWDILWSCFATIFACSWVAVHPDIPAPDEGWWRIIFRRLEYMFWTILTPEMMILWAARQWFGARTLIHLKDINNIDSVFVEHGWTETHAHFLQMGGFTLFDGKRSMGVLSHRHLSTLFRDGKVKFPDISAKEIEDHSKSDGLAKFLVIGQTTWFILQVITRKVQGLGTTKLEISSLAFAAINATIYFFWWNKPYDVRTSVPVYLLEPTETETMLDTLSEPLKTPFSVSGSSQEKPATDDSTIPEDNTPRWNFLPNIRAASGIRKLLSWPQKIIMFIALSLHNMSENYQEFQRFQRLWGPGITGLKKVPKFYAILGDYDMQVNLVVSVIGIIFGAIHCAAWSFRFPSVAELMIWRVGSLLITCVPALFLALVLSVDGVLKAPTDPYKKGLKGFIRINIAPLMFVVLLPLYGLARAALIAEALITLRDLSSNALSIVSWTTFIPHV